MTNAAGERSPALVQEILEVFPETTCKEHRGHMMISDPQMEGVGKYTILNRKSQPGVMTMRDYAYAGSKGVVFGPTKDMVHISHGLTGCGQYSHIGRHSYYVDVSGVDSFGTLDFTSDFQERDIIFGGGKKLTKLIEEMEQLSPLTRGITIQSERLVGLIDDDINAVANASNKALDKSVTLVRCEGLRGVPQSLGHYVANGVMYDQVLNNCEGQPFAGAPYDVATIDDYNIGGDAWASCILLEEMELRLVAQWSGDGTLVEMENTPPAKPNLVYCYRSMNYITRHMEEKHQIPWVEYNFFGPTKIIEPLHKIVDQFDDATHANMEAVIAKYEGQMAVIIAKYRLRLEGCKVLLHTEGLWPRHVIGAYEDLRIEIIAAGYEFAHNDDYDRILPDLKEDTLLSDDASSYELGAFTKVPKPDFVGSGIEEKYIFRKMGAPFRRTYSWDYSGSYHGYDGSAIFARDMDMTLNNPVWNELTAPWLKSA